MKYSFDAKGHVHTLDGQPLMGTSTVVKEVMPPFLAKWGAQCAVDHLKTVTDDYTGAVMAWSKSRDKSADAGTAMHAALEEYVKLCITAGGGEPIGYSDGVERVGRFVEWAHKYVDRFIFAEKNTYSSTLWVGGQVDCLALLKSGLLVVIDFKSSREAYFSSFVQCAGYALQLDESGFGDFDGSNWQKVPQPIGGLVIIPFGMTPLKPVLIENVAGYKDVFTNFVAIYKYLQSYKEKGGTILVD